MCRKNHLLGCAVAAFGLGMVVGNRLESGFLSLWGGIALVVLGICLAKNPRRF